MIKFGNPIQVVNHQTTDIPNLELLQRSPTVPMVKTAAVIKIVPKEEDFIYLRVRAVSAGNVMEGPDGTAEVIPIEAFLGDIKRYAKKVRGANDNGDFFSYEELVNTYKSFIGKSAFVDHQNENVEQARGIILDAAWNDRGKFVELLIAVDQVAYPELARGLQMGYITDVSMGCRCGYSICSICGNKAVAEEDFCEHVRNFKGSTYQGIPVFEDNRDIEFFECSFVTTGADNTAKVLERVAAKNHSRLTKVSNIPQQTALIRVASELNQRSHDTLRQHLKTGLSDLPWS